MDINIAFCVCVVMVSFSVCGIGEDLCGFAVTTLLRPHPLRDAILLVFGETEYCNVTRTRFHAPITIQLYYFRLPIQEEMKTNPLNPIKFIYRISRTTSTRNTWKENS